MLTAQVTKKVLSVTSGRRRGFLGYTSDDEENSEGAEKVDGKRMCFAASCQEESLAPLTSVSPPTSVAIALNPNLLRGGGVALGGARF